MIRGFQFYTSRGVDLPYVLFACGLLVAGLLGSMGTSPATAQGLVYADADDGFVGTANLSAGNPGLTLADVLDSGASVNNDDKWGFRAFGAGGTIFESGGASRPNPPGGVETALEMKQTLTGLTPNANYDVYVVYWTNTTQDWAIAGGFNSGEQVVYNLQGPNSFFPTATIGTDAASAVWSVLPADNPTSSDDIGGEPDPRLFFEGTDRRMLIGKVGTTSAIGGQIDVYINDPGGTTPGRRSWFDGLAYVEAGNEIFMSAIINRDTGALTINNPTGVDLQVKQYAVNSAAGSLDATVWTTIKGTIDGSPGGNSSFDTDIWNVVAPGEPSINPYAIQLSEAEDAAGAGTGGTFVGGSSLNLGNVWNRTPFEDVSISLTLADDSVVTVQPTYTGNAAVVGDFTGEGVVDLADFELLLSNLHEPFPEGLTAADRYQRGDITNNSVVNYNDFDAFRFAFDAANGPGAFAQMVAQVPEPGSMLLLAMAAAFILAGTRWLPRRRYALAFAGKQSGKPASVRWFSSRRRDSNVRFCQGAIASLALICAAASTANAAPVTGWLVDPLLPGPPAVLSNEATASPTLGDGTPNNAMQAAIFAAFPVQSLADGEQIVFSGSMTTVGTAPGADNLRFGIFKDDGVAPDTGGWLGHVVQVGSGNTNGDLLSRDPAGTDFANATFMSTTNGRAVGLAASFKSGTDLVDDTYQFHLTVQRFGSQLELYSSFTSAAGFFNHFRSTTESTAARITFDFDRVGFLAGNTIEADQINFQNLDVAKSATQTLTLEVDTTSGATKIVNDSGSSFDIGYYEIASTAGSLNATDWNALDEQEGTDPVGTSWDVAGGSSASILSEVNVQGATTLGIGASPLQLGNAFTPAGTEDLVFKYALPDGTLRRGFVEYVAAPGLLGDYNQNGAVDAADYTVWRDNLGSPTSLPNDDSAGVGADDYTRWKQNFGQTAPGAGAGSTAAVPEPATLALVALTMLCVNPWHRRRK